MSTPRDFIEEVHRRSDLVEVIGQDVALRPSGSVLKGLSPFNPEKNPSFVVWPSTQSWHDFSNGGSRGGDVFRYLMERDGLGFPEALGQLARQAGLKRPDEDEAEYARELARIARRQQFEKLLTQAATYYRRVLPTKVREQLYQAHYGFSGETIDLSQLGRGGGDLFDHLTDTCGASREQALATRLFVLGVCGEVHEPFRWRLVFPHC